MKRPSGRPCPLWRPGTRSPGARPSPARPCAVAAQTTGLDPYGHRFAGLYLGKTKLKKGSDYQLSGNSLTSDGDQLATTESTYLDDGSNAGPHAWTSFKEFDDAFAADVAAGELILRPRYFQEVEDQRPVELTFHLWSGDKVTYTIVRHGSADPTRPTEAPIPQTSPLLPDPRRAS